MIKKEIIVDNTNITIVSINEDDYISLTDIAKYKSDDPIAVISNWMRNRNTVEYLGIWESLYNQDFKPLEFEGFRKQAGLNAFTLSPQKWVKTTNAIGIISKSGRYGGTYAHKDIAFKFASWISVEFELYIVKEFQRLKQEEQNKIGWSAKRELARINYHIHTDAVRNKLVPTEVSMSQKNTIYAEEADVLNVAIFGMTAKEWRESNPNLNGNIRDYATVNELICISNMENINSVMINENVPQSERLEKLNKIAIHQMNILENCNNRKLLK
ncbi:MAG: KilA-N domain-containing protein [Bacteroidales bacterium]|nr:KilA-N domain-containing protein [Bacteroidales bacterium]